MRAFPHARTQRARPLLLPSPLPAVLSAQFLCSSSVNPCCSFLYGPLALLFTFPVPPSLPCSTRHAAPLCPPAMPCVPLRAPPSSVHEGAPLPTLAPHPFICVGPLTRLLPASGGSSLGCCCPIAALPPHIRSSCTEFLRAPATHCFSCLYPDPQRALSTLTLCHPPFGLPAHLQRRPNSCHVS